jgi:hypothetical protein
MYFVSLGDIHLSIPGTFSAALSDRSSEKFDNSSEISFRCKHFFQCDDSIRKLTDKSRMMESR